MKGLSHFAKNLEQEFNCSIQISLASRLQKTSLKPPFIVVPILLKNQIFAYMRFSLPHDINDIPHLIKKTQAYFFKLESGLLSFRPSSSGVIMISSKSEHEAHQLAFAIYRASRFKAFLPCPDFSKNTRSWTQLTKTMFFIPHSRDLKDKNKKQIKDFIYQKRTSASSQLVVALDKEDLWKIS